jgi:DNA-binding NtrC family response regulator
MNLLSILLQISIAIVATCMAWWLGWHRDDDGFRRLRRRWCRHGRPSVLVIDLEPTLALLGQALRDHGFTVCTTASLEGALALCRARRPAIVLGEWRLAGSREDRVALTALKEINPQIRYCLVGEGCSCPAGTGELGPVMSLLTPVTLDQLVDTLDAFAA